MRSAGYVLAGAARTKSLFWQASFMEGNSRCLFLDHSYRLNRATMAANPGVAYFFAFLDL
jgi:hypothetical protein